MKRLISALAFGVFVFLMPEIGYSAECGWEGRKQVQYNVEVAHRDYHGHFIFAPPRDFCQSVFQLKKGKFQKYGKNRVWGVNESGHYAPITSENGYILNVDPNEYVLALFAKEGVKVQPLPKHAVPVIVADNHEDQDERWKYLHVRAGGKYPWDSDSKVIDDVIVGQRVWVDRIELLLHNNFADHLTFVSMWGRIHSLYSSDAWVKIGFYFANRERNYEKLHLNISTNSWKNLVEHLPALQTVIDDAGIKNK